MTIGISKETLLRFNTDAFCPAGSSSKALLEQLIDQCQELNPWLPIDDNTPRDKWIRD